jgi:hypothetical protein
VEAYLERLAELNPQRLVELQSKIVGKPTEASDSHFRSVVKPMLIGNFGLLKNMSLPKGSPLLFRAGAIASLVLLVLLLLVPCAVLFFAVNPGSVSRHVRFSDVPVIYWALWATVSLWAGLDSPRLLRLLGKPVDPLSPQAVWGVLLGMLNVGASLLVVVLRWPR